MTSRRWWDNMWIGLFVASFTNTVMEHFDWTWAGIDGQKNGWWDVGFAAAIVVVAVWISYKERDGRSVWSRRNELPD